MMTIMSWVFIAIACGASWVVGYIMGTKDGFVRGKLRGHAEAKSLTVIHDWPVPSNLQNPMGKKKDDV